MKQLHRPWMAFLSSRNLFITLFVLLNIFTLSSSYASGSKMPEITDEGTLITDTSGDTVGSTTPPSSGGGSSTTTNLSSLNRPWSKSDSSIVIDAYEGNSIDWDKMATDKKVVGVIHRSSIGLTVDSLYKSRKKIALERGYLWGAYHLGRPGNTIAQADLLLSLVQDEPNTLMILDLENTTAGNFMTINEAIVFMDHIYQKSGRIPVVYANDSTTKLLNQKVKNNPIFQQSKLWYARFKSNISDYPSGIWPNYFLWQFSSELNCSTTGSCLYNVPGTKSDMDVNVFNGTARELAAQWNND